MKIETLVFEKQKQVGYLTLNRPKAMNAMDLVMMDELAACLEQLKEDKELQILIVKGAGGAFSAGGDVKGMQAGGGLDIDGAMVKVGKYIKSLYTLPMITIAQIHGAAAGLGLSTALACDFVIAEETSKIAMNFIGIGLVPDGGGHFFMRERLGNVKAKQMIWQGEVMSGTKAQVVGLVDELAAEGLLESKVSELSNRLLQAPLSAMIASKKILNGSKVKELEAIIEEETITQPLMRDTLDHKEGVQAFVEKRAPKFRGH